jgi:hypothetical protein
MRRIRSDDSKKSSDAALLRRIAAIRLWPRRAGRRAEREAERMKEEDSSDVGFRGSYR